MNDVNEIVDIGYLVCNCSNKHVPKPHKLFKVEIGDSMYHLCPTSYYNLTSLLEKWESCNGEPPGSVRKHYSDFVQGLAKAKKFS
jgi:hypothetical protein